MKKNSSETVFADYKSNSLNIISLHIQFWIYIKWKGNTYYYYFSFYIETQLMYSFLISVEYHSYMNMEYKLRHNSYTTYFKVKILKKTGQ